MYLKYLGDFLNPFFSYATFWGVAIASHGWKEKPIAFWKQQMSTKTTTLGSYGKVLGSKFHKI
jgi:hypothetical protein